MARRLLLRGLLTLFILSGAACGEPSLRETLRTHVGTWTWVPIPGSQCASGSTAGLGLNTPATGAGEELLVFLQGGGACWNQGTCVPSSLGYGPLCGYGTTCDLLAAGGRLPTASHVMAADPYPTDGGGAFEVEIEQLSTSKVLDRKDPHNPLRAATYVYVPYCTADLHAGDAVRIYPYRATAADPVSDYTVRFVGAKNMERYLAHLQAAYPAVRRVWLTGASAGGYGAALHFDRVQQAFPAAEVHLLADSSPLLHPSAHWPEWRDVWNLQLPAGCAGCEARVPALLEHLSASHPDRRFALLAHERDPVISWFFFAGAAEVPADAYAAGLAELLALYEGSPNARYFLAAGEGHVLWGGYGQLTAGGGSTAPLPSAGGGTDLRAWMIAWASGAAEWANAR